MLFSMLHWRFACARLHDSYMTRPSPRPLTITFTTAVFDRSSLWQFEAFPYTTAPKGLPSSFVQRDALASSSHNHLHQVESRIFAFQHAEHAQHTTNAACGRCPPLPAYRLTHR